MRRAAAAAAPVGGDELAFHVHRGKRQSGSFGDERRGRGGHGDEAVLAAHRAVPAGQIGHDNAVGRQVVGRHGDGNNVGDGIHGAHLVEVNFPNRYAMSPRLGVGHEAEHAVRDGLGAVGHGGTVDDLRYFRRAAVVVATGGTVGMVVIVGATMVAIVVMAVAVLACASVPVQVGHIMVVVLVGGIQHDAEVADVQTRLLHPGYLHSETFHRQALQRPAHRFLARACIQQGRRAHVAADTGGAFQVEKFRHCIAFHDGAALEAPAFGGNRRRFIPVGNSSD